MSKFLLLNDTHQTIKHLCFKIFSLSFLSISLYYFKDLTTIIVLIYQNVHYM